MIPILGGPETDGVRFHHATQNSSHFKPNCFILFCCSVTQSCLTLCDPKNFEQFYLESILFSLELFTSGIFHLIFLDCGQLQVTNWKAKLWLREEYCILAHT